MNESDTPSFPTYQPPRLAHMEMAHPKQVGPLFKVMKKMMTNKLMSKKMLRLPNKKVLQRRNRPVKKKFRIV